MDKKLKTNPAYLERLELVKAFIEKYWNENHYSPSLNEIADHFEVSTSVANYWLRRLEDDQWIEPRTKSVARNIVPVEIFNNRPVFPAKEQAYDPGI